MLILMTFSSGNIIKNFTGNFMLIPKNSLQDKPNCLF